MNTIAQPMASSQALRDFFAALGNRDLNAAQALFAEDVTFVAVRPGAVAPNGIYGTYLGRAGVADALTRVGTLLEPQTWEATHVGSEGPLGFAQGHFHYVVRATGRPFRSNWAMICGLRADGLIAWLNLYEDSEAFAQATA